MAEHILKSLKATMTVDELVFDTLRYLRPVVVDSLIEITDESVFKKAEATRAIKSLLTLHENSYLYDVLSSLIGMYDTDEFNALLTSVEAEIRRYRDNNLKRIMSHILGAFDYFELVKLGFSWHLADKFYFTFDRKDARRALDNARFEAYLSLMVFQQSADILKQFKLIPSEISIYMRQPAILDIDDKNSFCNEFMPEWPSTSVLERSIDTALGNTKYFLLLDDGFYADVKLFKQLSFVTENLAERQNQILNYFDENTFSKKVSTIEEKQGFAYNGEQKNALKTMLAHRIYVLEGLAGSGKTTVLHGFLELIPNDLTVMGVAFTGRASSNLGQVAQLPEGHYSTIHRWLASMYLETGQLPKSEDVDVLLIDEFSMIDLDLLAKLLHQVDNKTQIILVGDTAQLPSLNVGFARHLSALSGGALENQSLFSGYILSQVNRQGHDSLIANCANAIRVGELPNALTHYNVNMQEQDLQFLAVPNNQARDATLLDRTAKAYFYDVDTYKEPLANYRVIAPTNRLVYESNAMIQNGFVSAGWLKTNRYFKTENLKQPTTFYIGDRIITRKNDVAEEFDENPRDKPLMKRFYNGSSGQIIGMKFNRDSQIYGLNSEIKYVLVNFDGIGILKLRKRQLKDAIFKLGYASTVHTAQGMTIPHVVAVLPKVSRMNSRQLLYTAITRPSKTLSLVASPESVANCVNNDVYARERLVVDDLITSE